MAAHRMSYSSLPVESEEDKGRDVEAAAKREATMRIVYASVSCLCWLTCSSTLILANKMSRASLPVCTMLALWMFRVETPTNDVIRAVSITAVGCVVAAYGEVNLSLVGAMFAAANLSMESLRLVMTQFLLQGVDLPAMQTLKFIAPSATLCLVVSSYIQEYPRMKATGALSIPWAHPLFFCMAASLGLVVNVLGIMIIKLSSATTLKVLAAVRGPIIVLAGVTLFQEHVSMLEFFGYCIALVGFVWYNHAKATQALAAPKAAPRS